MYFSPKNPQPAFLPQTSSPQIPVVYSWSQISSLEQQVIAIQKSVGPKVVNIIMKKELDVYKRDPFGFFQEKIGSIEKTLGGGSGFFVSKDGLIMTNKHVVSDREASYSIITSDGMEYDAKVLAFDPLSDIALLQIVSSQSNTFLPLEAIENENSINIGQFAIAIWNALWTFQNSLSFWVISGKNRSIEASTLFGESQQLSGLIQTDVAINPGNSGWPLINLEGKLMWVNTAIAGDSQWVGFSIPMSQKRIDYIIESVQKYGVIKQPFIWILTVPLTPDIAGKNALASDKWAYIPEGPETVLPESPAAKAWLKQGDIILKVDGQDITYAQPISLFLQNKIPWDSVVLTILSKDNSQKEITVILWEK